LRRTEVKALKSTTMRAGGIYVFALAILASQAIGIASADGSSTAPSVSVQIAPAAPPTSVHPLNVEGGLCLNGPGEPCVVDFTMGKGTATATFTFSDGDTEKGSKTCTESFCTGVATGNPNNPNISVVTFSISGPNIDVVFINL
jgi:hypothetical protein